MHSLHQLPDRHTDPTLAQDKSSTRSGEPRISLGRTSEQAMRSTDYLTQICQIQQAVDILCRSEPNLTLEAAADALTALIYAASIVPPGNKLIQEVARTAYLSRAVQEALPPWR